MYDQHETWKHGFFFLMGYLVTYPTSIRLCDSDMIRIIYGSFANDALWDRVWVVLVYLEVLMEEGFVS